MVFGKVEDIAPPASLFVMFELGHVEIRPAAIGKDLPQIVVEIENEIEQGAGNWLTLVKHMRLRQVKAAHPRNQHTGGACQRVMLAGRRIIVGNRSRICVAQIDLSLDHVAPSRRERIFEIGHESLDRRVQRIDHHFAVGRTGDFDAAVK